MGKLILLVAGAAFAALPASSSAGAPVTVEFSGNVTLVQDETPILDGSVQVGTPFSGSFTYDSQAVDQNPDPTLGLYLFTSPPAAFRIAVGNYVFEAPSSAPDLAMFIENSGARDGFAIGGGTPISISGPLDPVFEAFLEQETTVGFGLSAPPPGPLTGDGLPTSAPAVSDWTTRLIRIEASPGPSPIFSIQGTVTTIVPEPSTACLLLVALSGMAGLARLRARRF
jgi:hypothetical protein